MMRTGRLASANCPRKLSLISRLENVRFAARFTSSVSSRQVGPVEELHGSTDISTLKSHVWDSTTPVVIRNAHSLPAMTKWFTHDNDKSSQGPLSPYLQSFDQTVVPYEFTSHQSQIGPWSTFLGWLDLHSSIRVPELEKIVIRSLSQPQDASPQFHQLQGPLGLLAKASQYNQTKPAAEQLTHLYIAQSDIRDLPELLSRDLPSPELVKHSPRGDVYSSSIWLGLQPTHTPLHEDPNPNIFCQLHGSKTVRLLSSRSALAIFRDIQRQLGANANPKLRGTEMMQGPERELLHQAIWHPKPDTNDNIKEAVVKPGDALFIPRGWWHTVVSQGRAGELNASANWWCR